jgi:hypothetical protein
MGASLRTTCPVVDETFSIVPSTGAFTTLLNNPKIPFVWAITSPFLTSSPSFFNIISLISEGSIFNKFATFTICTLPGKDVEATISLG